MRRANGYAMSCVWACALSGMLAVAPAQAAELTFRLPDAKLDAAADRACAFFQKCPDDFEPKMQYLMNRLVSFISFETYKGMESLDMTLEVWREDEPFEIYFGPVAAEEVRRDE